MKTAKIGAARQQHCLMLLQFVAALCSAPIMPAYGQDMSHAGQAADEIVAPPRGAAPETAAGRVGQRQTRGLAAEAIRVEPLARIGNRIQNRVQSRIRNRIDQNYDPLANASAPFKLANEQIRGGIARGKR